MTMAASRSLCSSGRQEEPLVVPGPSPRNQELGKASGSDGTEPEGRMG